MLLLDCPELYDRSGIYYDARGDYADNAVRYAFLSAAAIDWASQQDDPFDIVHAHDWQGGLAPVYARRLRCAAPCLRCRRSSRSTTWRIKESSTRAWVPRLGLSWHDFTINGFEFFDRLSFMKAGINFADAITTVSPTYAEEIQRPEYGNGLDGVIRSRQRRARRHPERHRSRRVESRRRFVPAGAVRRGRALDGKAAAKRALLEAFGFTITDELLARPVIGMVSRMVDQKGLDLIAAAARRSRLARRDIRDRRHRRAALPGHVDEPVAVRVPIAFASSSASTSAARTWSKAARTSS